MLQDLEQRGDGIDGQETDYQPPKTIGGRKLTLVAILLAATVVFYFLLKAITPSQLDAVMELISGDKPEPVAQTTTVSVNEALDKMMPAKSTSPDPNPVPETQTSADSTLALTGNTQAANTNSDEMGESAAPQSENTASPERVVSNNLADIDDSVVDATQNTPVLLDPENVPPEAAIPESSGELRVSRAEAITPEDQIANLLMLGTEAAQNQEYGKATAAFDAILELDPNRHDVRKRLSVILYAQNRDNRVVSLLQDGIQLSPDRADLRLMLGRLWHRQNKTNDLYEVLKPIDPNVEDNSEYLELKASAATELGLFPEAASLYERLANHSPEQSRWWLGLAIAQDKQGNVRDALEAYLRAYELQQLPGSVSEFVNKRIAVLGG